MKEIFPPIAGLTAAVLTVVTCAAPGIAQTSLAQAPMPAEESGPVAEPGESTEIPVTPPEATPTSGETPEAAPEAAPTTIQSPLVPAAPNSIQPSLLSPNRTAIPRPQVPAAEYREDVYVLGAGDAIGIDIFDVPEFSGAAGQYTVLIDGSINFPWIGRVMAQGLTLQQLSDVLTRAYAPYIRNPLITVNLLSARTLRVSVAGEVRRPGSYIVSPAGEGNEPLVGIEGAAGTGGSQWPTVTQAIQSAGGITQLADLRGVQIRRPQVDGSEQVIDVNLMELIKSGDIRQDVTIRDRDVIFIPTATTLSEDEALLTGSASFAPGTIQVAVVGEVDAPGVIEMSPNTPLNQAISRAGGFDKQRARTSRVELIRLNPNGTAVRRTIEIDMAAGVNEETNPALRDNDTILVGRSGLTSFSDTLDTIFAPIGNLFGLFDFVDRIAD